MSQETRRISNYEIAKYRMEKEFLKFDQETILKKFPLFYEEGYLYIDFVNKPYCVDRKTGRVSWSADGFITLHEATYNDAMTIYDVLCYSCGDACLSGEFVNMKSLSSIQGSSDPVADTFYQETEKLWDHKSEALSRACQRLKAKKAGRGDVAYDIPLFDFLPVRIQFWNSDEEFPPSLQFLFDKHVLQYMHFETLWFAVSHLIERLKEEMALDEQ